MADQLLFMPQTAWQLGEVASGAKLYFYVSGTTTPLTVYTDTSYATPHPQPIEADASGVFPAVFFGGSDLAKAVMTTSDDASIATVDPVAKGVSDGAGASSVSFSPVTDNANTNVQDAIEKNTSDIGEKANNDLSDLSDVSASQTNLGLGTAATKDTGTASGEVLSFSEDGKLPALDGSDLTGGVVIGSYGDEVSAASGTEVEMTNVPANMQEMKLGLNRVSLSGADELVIQLGTADQWFTSGYDSQSNGFFGNATSFGTSTDGFLVKLFASSAISTGHFDITKSGSVWMLSGASTATNEGVVSSGVSPDITEPITRVRVVPTGSDTFSGGSVTPAYKAWIS